MRYDEPSLPNPHLDEPTLDAVVRYLLSPECKRVAVISGAGISAANGIPTYRGAGGLYESLDATKLTASPADRAALVAPEHVFSRELFLRNPLPCLEMKRDFVLNVQDGNYSPTLFHRFVELIASHTGKLVRVYDQNIDGLMLRCERIPSHLVRTPHGRVDRAACERCGFGASFDAFCAHMRSSIRDISGTDPTAPSESTPMRCTHCGELAVKPASVLFGAPLALDVPPELDDALDEVDLLLIAGTTLKVAPINGVPCFVPPHCVRVVLNDSPVGEELQPMPLEYGPHAARDIFLRGPIDATSFKLLAACGWLPEVRRVFVDPAFAMPPQSRRFLGQQLLGATMPTGIPSHMYQRRYYAGDANNADACKLVAEEPDPGLPAHADRTRLFVCTNAALDRLISKSADGRIFVRLERESTNARERTGGSAGKGRSDEAVGDDDDDDLDLSLRPILIAERSHHDVRQSVRSWLQTAVTDLAHRLPASLPPSAKRDAAAQREGLRACLSLRAGGFQIHVNDPTGASCIEGC